MLLKFIATAILSRHNTHSTEGDRKKSKPQNVGDQNICESSDVPGSLGYSLSTISFFCLPPRGVDAEVLTPPSQNGMRSRQERLHSRRKGARGEGWRGCRNGRARADPMQSPLNAGNGDKRCRVFTLLPHRPDGICKKQACPSLDPSLSSSAAKTRPCDRDQERTAEMGRWEQISMRERERRQPKKEGICCVRGRNLSEAELLPFPRRNLFDGR